jgi:hypothetical protein
VTRRTARPSFNARVFEVCLGRRVADYEKLRD